ncbi:MAG TPA: hypothetical protein VNF04_16940 [Stellaceae bacterium]|nr:hypothetical protein [Stellaceae bacterium]
MIGYQEDSAIWALSASPAQVREKLSEVARLAKSLRKSLARLARGDASPADAIAWERLARMADRLPGGRCLPEVGKSVAFVEAVAKQAAAEIVGRDGPKGNPYRRVFIRELHAIFLAAGGKGKITKRSGQYAGRFSEMVSAALATIDGDVPTKGALVRAIEAAFGAQDGPKVA